MAERHLAEVYLVDAALEFGGGKGGDEFVDGEEVHEIGCVDCGVDAEDSVRSGFSPALHRVVFDVVYDETGAVKMLDESAHPHCLLFELVVEQLVDEQCCYYSHVLAAQLPEVVVGL